MNQNEKPPSNTPIPIQNIYDAVNAAWTAQPRPDGPGPEALEAFERTLARTPGRHDYVMLGLRWPRVVARRVARDVPPGRN